MIVPPLIVCQWVDQIFRSVFNISRGVRLRAVGLGAVVIRACTFKSEWPLLRKTTAEGYGVPVYGGVVSVPTKKAPTLGLSVGAFLT